MTEAQILRAIKDFLNYHMNLGNLVWNRQPCGAQYPGGKRKIEACHPGTPDMVVHRNGLTLYIEIKSKEGKLKPEQVEFHKLLYAQGISTYTVRSVEEVQERLGL